MGNVVIGTPCSDTQRLHLHYRLARGVALDGVHVALYLRQAIVVNVR